MFTRRSYVVRLFIAFALLLVVLSTVSPSTAQDQVTLKYTSWMSKGEDKPTLAAFMKKYPNIKVEDLFWTVRITIRC